MNSGIVEITDQRERVFEIGVPSMQDKFPGLIVENSILR